MLKSKANWTCSYCSKILKDPILLPCEDNICRLHLKEKDSVKQNAIKCVKCKENFPIKGHDFKSNKTLKQLIEDKSYLSEEEMNLKKNLEESIRKFFGFYDNFILNKSKVDTDVFNHFQELRFQIDEHRERLKAKIDDVALEMIEQTKKCEAEYLKEVKENLLSSFGESKSLDKELEEIEEFFRNPNLLIQSIKEMQQRQEESLKEIQSKLNEINQVQVDLKATNEFKPNLTLLNKELSSSLSSSFFGSMKLNNCSNADPFTSQILTGNQPNELIKLCEFSPNDKWSLLYRGTRDGFSAQDFHSKCDNKSPTLSIFKAHDSSYIFGGFTTVSWESTNGKWKSDRNAFIFSLKNKDNTPLKMKVDPNYHQYAIGCHSVFGPSFGGDIVIANNANTMMDSYSDLGYSYIHPQYAYRSNEAETFLAGSHQFQLDEIEVYQKE
jgi:hypothetical protein